MLLAFIVLLQNKHTSLAENGENLISARINAVTCAICPQSLDNVNDVVTLREKGSEGINRASTWRNDLIQTVPGQKVHQTCRREYCHPSYINKRFWANRASYRIYSINLPGRLLNFWTLRVGAYSRWALMRGWALIRINTVSQTTSSYSIRFMYILTE